MTADRLGRLLRWYPPEWRERYGAEMTALLEDAYGTASAVPWRERMGLARSGLAERARAAGLLGSVPDPAEQVRAGSALVLCGWALFVIAGAIFAKFADGWSVPAPSSDRWVASAAYDAVAVLGAVGCALVALAALLAAPAFVRLIRDGRWESVRRRVGRAVAAAGTAALLLVGALSWAHHLSQHDRNGGLPVYSTLFVIVGLAVVVAVLSAAAAGARVARRIESPPRVVRILGVLALAVGVVMVLLAAGIVVWWCWVAVHAPDVLRNGIGNGFPYASNTAPPTLVVTGGLIVMGVVLAVSGTRRVARSWRAAAGD